MKYIQHLTFMNHFLYTSIHVDLLYPFTSLQIYPPTRVKSKEINPVNRC